MKKRHDQHNQSMTECNQSASPALRYGVISSELQEDDLLSPFETAFIQAALKYQGTRGMPTLPQFRAVLEIMSAYAKHRADNPLEPEIEVWLASLSEDEHATIVATAYLHFGVTKFTR